MDLREHSLVLQIWLLVAVTATCFWLKRWSTRRQHAAALWPPGPPAWPLLGHLHLLGDLPHQSLCKLSKTYGPLMGLRLGGVSTIVASSPETAREILQTNDLAFANRPRFAAAVHIFFDCSDIGFVPYGSLLTRMRHLCAAELFNSKRLASFRGVREGEVRDLMRQLVEVGAGGRLAVEVRHGLRAASTNITCRMTMGKKLEEVSVQGGRLKLLSLMEEIILLLAVFNVGDFVPWLQWLDPQGYVRRMKAAGRQAKNLMQEVIRQRRLEPRVSPEDLLDVLLAAVTESSSEISLTEENVMGIILDFFMGGSNTSAVTVEWALADLINSPQKLQKLQAELDAAVGKSRLVSEDDVHSVPYLTSVLKESMRLHPAAPLLLPHESSRECRIGAYTIPRGARAYVNAWAIARDPSVWDRPLEFLPERFEGNSSDLRGRDFDLLPFGRGRRGCPGWALGSSNVHIMLASLVHGFDWHPERVASEDRGFVDMSEKFGLTVTLAKPLRALATPRLPAHLY